jgi:uracil-DNA glycosylase family 4
MSPDAFNAPVPSFGAQNGRVLILGLAPGLNGANRTGRPFTGDYAGDLLYATLQRFGLSQGAYGGSPLDGVRLPDALISNAVRCAPPDNKPTGEEISTCRTFLVGRINAMPRLRIILALGRIAHDSLLRAVAIRAADAPFGHGRRHELQTGGRSLTLYDSYHCSRYNTNTGRLTEAMFHDVFAALRDELETL